MGIYVFSRDALLDILMGPGTDFGKEVIPAALATHRVHAYLHRGYWVDVGTVRSFYDANILLTQRSAPFNFFHPRFPIYTRPRFLPGSRFIDCRTDAAIVCDGCSLDTCSISASVVGIRTIVRPEAQITRSVLLGADVYEEVEGVRYGGVPTLGVGRGAVLDRVIVDKNARIGDGVRLTNERGLSDADGDGYCIRDGIIVVHKGATIPDGTVI
jgi:glucose-1-phosphate adenylyltransferase